MKKLIIILAILNIFSPLHAVVYHFFNGEKLLEADDKLLDVVTVYGRDVDVI